MNYGFLRVAAASLKLKVANPSYNKEEIKKAIDKALEEQARILVTPELSITGYTCADLFFTKALQNAAEAALDDIIEYTKGKNIVVIVGAPYKSKSKLFNCAYTICDGEVKLITPKKNIANYNEFYEKRWFVSGDKAEEFSDKYGCAIDSRIELCKGVVLGIELCEDLWTPEPPSSRLAVEGANVMVNLSASDEYVSKAQYRRELIANQSARCISAYIYAGASVYESTTDLVFSGATVIAENGAIVAEGERFSRENVITIADIDIEKLDALRQRNMSFENSAVYYYDMEFLKNESNDLKYRFVDPHPFVPADDEKRRERCREIFSIQAAGLAKRLEHVGSSGAVIGISGGLDSTLALLVAVEAMKLLGKENSDILGVTMPGFGTTDRTYNNALELMKSLGVTVKEISIKGACIQHMKDIEHDPDIKDITYENTQARERTQILFDLANKHGKLLVGTGDLSELAMGWCTYNGDHMSMYGVNASVPKTLVRYLVDYVASVSDEKTAAILYDVLDPPVSPELLPPDENGEIAQKNRGKHRTLRASRFLPLSFRSLRFHQRKACVYREKGVR